MSRLRSTAGLALPLLVAAGLLSACLNVVLLVELREAFQKLQLVRVFPMGFVPDIDALTGGREVSVSLSIWGDSRALAWSTSLAGSFQGATSFAHGGVTTSQLLIQLKTEPVVVSDIAVVQIGINDLHPLGVLQTERPEMLRQLERNLREIRDILHMRSRVLVFSTILPPDHVPLYRRMGWASDTIGQLETANRLISDFARKNEAIILDANRLLAASDSFLDPRFRIPGSFLHVNDDAYALLTQELKRLLELHEANGRGNGA